MAVEKEVAQQFLYQPIEANANERSLPWLIKQQEKIRASYTDRAFYLAFGRAPRFAEKQELALSETQQAAASSLTTSLMPPWTASSDPIGPFPKEMFQHAEPAF